MPVDRFRKEDDRGEVFHDFEGLGPDPVALSFSLTSSWNSSLKIVSLLSLSSFCNFKIPRFSSALITWFSFRIRTAFIRLCLLPLIT